MADKLIEVAEAIKDFLPTQTYSDLASTAENTVRLYAPIRDVDQLSEHKIVVIPSRKQDMGRTCRDARLNIKTLFIHILIEKHVKSEDNALCDPIRTLASEIENHLRVNDVMADVGLLTIDDIVVSDDDLLVQNNVFISELQAQYKRG